MPSQLTPGAAQALMASHLPPKWKVIHPKSHRVRNLGGECNYSKRIIKCGPVVDDYSFLTFLHEVGHALLHRPSLEFGSLQEWEAEQYAMKMFRSRGLRVSRRMLEHGKANVMSHVERERDAGKTIDPRVLKWIDPKAPARDRAKYEKRKVRDAA